MGQGGQQDFSLLLTESHFTPYGNWISFPWNFYFSFKPSYVWPQILFLLAEMLQTHFGHHVGAGGQEVPPYLLPFSFPLIQSKERGHKWKHADLLGFLSLELGACLINIIWGWERTAFPQASLLSHFIIIHRDKNGPNWRCWGSI